MTKPSKYRRILIKLSGEALMGQTKFGHDISIISQICDDIKSAKESGYQICIVVLRLVVVYTLCVDAPLLVLQLVLTFCHAMQGAWPEMARVFAFAVRTFLW